MRDPTTVSRPAIYYLHPLLAGPFGGWGWHLDRCRGMGFTDLMIAPPFKPGRGGDLFQTADHDHTHPALDYDGAADAMLAEIAEECRQRDLSLWLDLVLDRVAADAALIRRHPDWFATEGTDPLPDPRERFPRSRAAPFRATPDSSAALIAWWCDKLAAWMDAGVAGFRIPRPTAVPAEFLDAVIAAARSVRADSRFLAWTPGLTPTDLDALRGCRVDGTVASTCWWDFRDEWYDDELSRLEAVAPPLALSEPPFGARLAESLGGSASLEDGYRRLIRYCATSGRGWLMPMGFEFASAAPLDPTYADPASFRAQAEASNVQLAAAIAAANAEGDHLARKDAAPHWRRLSAPGAAVLAELSTETGRLRVVNASNDRCETVEPEALLARCGEALALSMPQNAEHGMLRLGPAEIRLLDVVPSAAVKLPAPQARRQAAGAARLPRLIIDNITPIVDGGRHAVKRVLGDGIMVEADVFGDGHGAIATDLLWRAADEKDWRRVPMQPLGNDRWRATFRPRRIGEHLFTIEAWPDAFATLQHGLRKKHEAGLAVDLEVTEIRQSLDALVPIDDRAASRLAALRKRIAEAGGDQRLALLLAVETAAAVRQSALRTGALRREPVVPVTVDRGKAVFSSWYELFPRSQSGSRDRHGTFDDVIRRLPAIAEMGFDTLYFPPIHPIGRINRKGRNNNPKAAPGEPGSPYAIGSEEGGHDAVHPELGTIEDFRRLRAAAEAHGLELALDFAIQCAPDHPWLKLHPEWFAWRPDGSVAYAENPPKKYEDIVNVDFYAETAVPALWIALRDIVLYWRMEGVRTFRVDNPHTKPLPFWRWLIADIRARFPDTLFLSEAFTRPQVMYALAKAGFSQSYTYFTWRNTKAEIESYLIELTAGPPADFFRPHFFVNTPDINPFFLQRSGRAGFLIRAALATTLSGLWGVYSGFELCEAAPLPGREEYLDSEKYEIKAWDWDRPGHIKAEIAILNRLRRRNPALQTHLGLRFQVAHNDNITFFTKMTPDRSNLLLIAINLDPFHVQEAAIEIPFWQWGLPDHAAIELQDLVGGARFRFQGKHQRVRIDPQDLPFAIWRAALPEQAG